MRRKRHRKIQIMLLLLSTIGLIFIFVFMSPSSLVLAPDKEETEATSLPAGSVENSSPTPDVLVIEPSPPPPAPVFADAVWMGVGDIMMHSPQLPGSYDAATKTYNFTPFFAEVKPILEQGDWVMANLETPLSGRDVSYSGYPMFNAPFELADAMKQAGFNLVTNANNHSLDRGEKGVRSTLEYLKEYGFQTTGTFTSEEEAAQLLLSEKNGIVMGVLAYTYGTNGIPVPEGKPYLVSLIDEAKIIADIKRIREAGADVITVALHFGTEYQTVPNEEQKRLARSLIAAGADIIAGSHPHVVQPYEVIETVDENGHARKALIIYSMGNFISNQRGETKDSGVIFKVNIRKNMTDNTIDITEVDSIPTWVHRYKPDRSFRYRILPIEDTIASASDTLLTQADYDILKTNYQLLRNRLDSMKK